MSHRRNVPQPDRPRLRLSNWEQLGLYRYDCTGKRQDNRVQPYYAKPPSQRRKLTQKGELKRQQRKLATALGITKELKERHEAEAYLHSATIGALSPVRQRQLAEGFANVGLAHLA